MFLINVSSHPGRGHFITPAPVNTGLESHPKLLTHSKADSLPSLPTVAIPALARDRRQQSAPHQSTWRRVFPRAPTSPLSPPTRPAQTGPSPSPGTESRLLDGRSGAEGTNIFPFPPLLQSHSSSFHPFRDVARASVQGLPAGPGPRAAPESWVCALAPAWAASLGPPLPGLGTPPDARGARAPTGRGRTPALPGEVCKHSCSRAREPLEVEATRATPRGGEGRKGPAGGGWLSRPQLWGKPGRPPAAAAPGPYTQPRARPRTHRNLPGSSGKWAPHTLQEGHTRPPGCSRETRGCQFGRRSEARTVPSRLPRRIRFNRLSKDHL